MPRGERYKKIKSSSVELLFFIGTRIHKAAMGRDVPPFLVILQRSCISSCEATYRIAVRQYIELSQTAYRPGIKYIARQKVSIKSGVRGQESGVDPSVKILGEF